jgi:hypothetical protein
VKSVIWEIPTPWSRRTDSSGDFAQANLVRDRLGLLSNRMEGFRFAKDSAWRNNAGLLGATASSTLER